MSADPTKVFAYSNGTETLYADPLAIRRKLVTAIGGTWRKLVNQYFAPVRDGADDAEKDEAEFQRYQAADVVLKGTRIAFDLPAFDPKTGEGATDADAERALAAWLDWCDQQKKRLGT